MDLIFKDEAYAIIGAAVEVHRVLGPGFLEAVYQEAMEYELSQQDIPFTAQAALSIQYKGHKLKKEYYVDLICFNNIIVELKALDRLSGKDESQVLNYLKATGLKLALLINFGRHGKLEWKRFVY